MLRPEEQYLRLECLAPLLGLHCLVDDIGERCIAIEDMDIEAFVFQGTHRIEPFLFPRASTTDPYLHIFHLAFGLGFAKTVDDSAERFLDVGEVRNRAADDD